MLEPSADEIRDWGNSVTQFMIEYLGELRDRPVYRHTSSREIRSGLDSKLPIKGTDFDSLLKAFRDTIVPFSRQNAHPRMFGYMQSPGTPIGAFADLLASTLNANLTIWRSAPAPVELERVTIDWIRQILRFPTEASGLFVSGGSMANLAALAGGVNRFHHIRSPTPLDKQTVIRMNENHAGIYGTVVRTGEIRVGQVVSLRE